MSSFRFGEKLRAECREEEEHEADLAVRWPPCAHFDPEPLQDDGRDERGVRGVEAPDRGVRGVRGVDTAEPEFCHAAAIENAADTRAAAMSMAKAFAASCAEVC